MRRLLWTLVGFALASVLYFVLFAPPQPLRVDASAWTELATRTVPGAYHIHTTRSDGHGDRHAVAAAAARAGLKFIILTDHGDGTRPPDPPEYIDGVLVLDGVEISTDDGHFVAIDMPRAPYPLGGAGEAVAEDVARLGGFGIAAHPDSPKPLLRWTPENVPLDGIEWLNLDSEWRDETRGHLIKAGLGYFLRPGPALATILDRPVTLARWDKMTKTHRVVALAAADAHGGAGVRPEDPSRNLFNTIGIPSYEASFRAFSNSVVLDRPLSGKADQDGRAIYGAIRKGSVFSVVNGLATPALLDFHVESVLRTTPMGDGMDSDSDVTIVARAPMPSSAQMVLVKDGKILARSTDELRRPLNAAEGAYHVEIWLASAPGTPPVPWVVSNPIYFGPTPRSRLPLPPPLKVATPIAPFPWRIEKDSASSAVLRTSDHDATLEYQLADGSRGTQFVALATDLHNPAFKSIDLGLAVDRPSRVSIQVRRQNGDRWGRSFYVDPKGTSLDVPLSSLEPIGDGDGRAPVSELTSLLLVIDLTNAVPGHAGTLRVLSSALGK